MSSTLSSAGDGVEGIVYTEQDITEQDTDRASGKPGRSIRMTPSRLLMAVLLSGSALGGAGFAGHYLATYDSGLTLLSDTAHVGAGPFAAPAPIDTADAGAVEEIRSDYESRLAAMIDQQQRLRGELERAQQRHQDARTELGRTERSLNEASRDLDQATRELAALRTVTERRDEQTLGSTEALVDAESKVQKLSLELAAAESVKDGLTKTLETFAGTMERVIAERDDAAAKAESMDERVAALSEKQEKVLVQLEDAARISLSGMRRMFERSGLDVDRILGETREEYSGAGGPFEALANEVGDGAEPTGVRVAALTGTLEEVNLMRFAAKRLPFGMPVRGVRMTSNFGPRKDPLGRGRAMHKGTDFAGPKDTPIYATADGVVTYSGLQRGYGRIVTIRHAFGVETRYAHLNRSRVKVGQRVERGDHIADMGNTGRSTGTHLHYEVRIDREAVNPAKFIEAANDVL